MKILLSNKFFYPRGGDCIHMIALKNLLEQQGHEVAIFAMDFAENLESEYAIYWPSTLDFSSKKPGNIKEALLRPLFSKEVKQKWNALLDTFQPDVVHLHNIHTQLSPIIAQEAKKRNIPVFWTLHDYKLICPAYTFLRDGEVCEECLKDSKQVLKNKCIKNSIPGSIIGYLEAKKWSRKKLENYTTAFISPSAFLKNKMESAGYSTNKIKHVYNFAEADKFAAETNKDDYCVYLGRLSKEKGVETLLQAMNKNPACKLKIIGDGPIRKELEEKYAAKHIDFLGFRKWEEIKSILGKARFLVIPSEWYENNPLTVIESLAVGTPVLGAAIGGIPELIDENNGMLFESKNAEQLENKMSEMLNKTDWNYQEISNAACKKFSTSNYYQQLMSLYQQ